MSFLISFSVFASIFLSSNIDFTFSFKCQCKVFFNSNYQILPCSILAESSAMWLSSRLSTMQALSWSCWINAGQIRTKSSSFNPSSSFTSWSSRSSCPVKHWNTYANVKLLGHAFKYSVHVNYRDMEAWNFYTISFINSKCMCQRRQWINRWKFHSFTLWILLKNLFVVTGQARFSILP